MMAQTCVCYGKNRKTHARGSKGCIWHGIPPDLWHKSHFDAQKSMEQSNNSERAGMVSKPRVRERAEELGTFMNEEQQSAVRQLANELHRVNNAVIRCVEMGLAVELQRVARHHAEGGYWGDMLIPVVMKQDTKKDL